MSISTFSRQATPQEMAVEIDRRGRVIESLEGEIQRLRVALEFYATHTNYISRIGMESPLTKDNFGDRARSALHQSEKNAGLKAEARVVWEKAHAGHLRQLGACWMDEPPPEDTIAAFGGSVRSAAHAAGKAEVEAVLRGIAGLIGLPYALDIEVEHVRRAILDAESAARAEALEEALAAARAAGEEACKGFVLTGPAGIVSRMLAAIRALISAPLPPREES